MQMITSLDELFNYICMFLVQLLKYVFGFSQKPNRHKFESHIIITPVTYFHTHIIEDEEWSLISCLVYS